jgi:hypothetical protein
VTLLELLADAVLPGISAQLDCDSPRLRAAWANSALERTLLPWRARQ